MADSSPLIPFAAAEASKPAKIPFSWYRKWLVFAVLPAAGICNMIPYFAGQKCPGIPSSFEFAIVFTVFSLLKAILIGTNNTRRLKARLKPTIDTKPTKDARDFAYTGSKAVHYSDLAMSLLQLVTGIFWALPLAITHWDLKGVDDPTICQPGVFLFVFITGVVTASLFVLIVVGGSIWYLWFKKAEEEEEAERSKTSHSSMSASS